MTSQFHELVLSLKKVLFAKSGEPYRFGSQTLRFSPGTRPVRTKYRTSANDNVRNDALQVELILQSLQAGDFAIDIGAHAGQYGILMTSRCGPTGKVVSFEPDPDAITKMEANLRLNPTLTPPQIVQAACSDANGTATFFTQGGNAQSSLAKSALPKDRDTQSITVQTVRLDDWWAAANLGTPALVKIDTEGAEVHVLRGMPNILASNAKIVCELHPFAWEEFGVTFQDIEKVAADAGRTLMWLDGRGRVSAPGEYGTVLLERI